MPSPCCSDICFLERHNIGSVIRLRSSDNRGGASVDLDQNPNTGDPDTEPGSPASSRPGGSPTAFRSKTREREKSSIAGKAAVTVDHAARSEEVTPWPAGPRLFAEVVTGTQRHLNVRPNIIGLMPRIRVDPGDPVILKLRGPDSSPGDVVYIELADGGSFPGSSALSGKKVTLGENRSVEVPITTDMRPGNCTVIIRQAGHSRTLPIWVGPLPEVAGGDSDPN